MKEFRIIQTCTVCGGAFDSDYKLAKHMSMNHPIADKLGWVGEEDSCGCGGESSHSPNDC